MTSANARIKTIVNLVKDDRLILTPGVHKWLVKHPEGLVLDEELTSLLSKLTRKQPRDRSASFSCSARNQCVRRQQFQFIGLPQQRTLDAELQNKFNDGTWRHLRWQMMLLKAGLLTEIEYPVYSKALNLRGSMDGRGVSKRYGNFGFELKGVGSLSFIPEGPYPNHIYQIHSYFAADSSLDVFSLVYEDKMTQRWKEFVIERDPVVMRAVRKELARLNRATAKKQLLPVFEECKYARGPTYRQCPYSGTCLTATWESAEAEAIEVRNQALSRRRGVRPSKRVPKRTG